VKIGLKLILGAFSHIKVIIMEGEIC
jgi:hypothetical protein